MSALNSAVNDRRARAFLFATLSILDILSGAPPRLVDVRQTVPTPGTRQRAAVPRSRRARTPPTPVQVRGHRRAAAPHGRADLTRRPATTDRRSLLWRQAAGQPPSTRSRRR